MSTKTETQYREAWRAHFAEMQSIMYDHNIDDIKLSEYQWNQFYLQFETMLDKACADLNAINQWEK